MRVKTIRQTATIRATPARVYSALMTTKGHEAFTGASARISGKVGGRFTAWDGYIEGRNLELVPGKKIVQAWRPAEEEWPEDYYSTVTFVLTPTRGGTRIRFLQRGVLSQYAAELAQGWKDHYWRRLNAYLADDA
jgi:uncharacterized protein YndB with AHSA1/START domain